jgi:uncharacterized 2Fe-2S/4Fe-4S cluster protein (DUF4445 family)
MSSTCGLAVDVGTTKLVVELVDADSGHVAATAAAPNPQVQFGADVMSRIAYAQSGPAQTRELHTVLVAELNRLVNVCLAGAGIAKADIGQAVFVGNATMLHTLLGLDPTPLGELPFRGQLEKGWHGPARELGMDLLADAWLPPGIRSHAGADTLAAMLATNLDTQTAPALLIDLGTNSEIVLATPADLLCTSTAAGPAFESDSHAARLRGSQLISAVAQRLQHGAIDRSGRMASADSAVTPEEVRQLQLAKAGVAAGIETLLERAGLDAAQLQAVFIAGAFGNYLDAQSALTIGLLPPVAVERITFVGNAALAGARQLLRGEATRGRAQEVAVRTRYLELGGHRGYEDAFIRAIPFPDPRARLVDTLAALTGDIAQQALTRCPYRTVLDHCTFRGPCRNRVSVHADAAHCGGGTLNSNPA